MNFKLLLYKTRCYLNEGNEYWNTSVLTKNEFLKLICVITVSIVIKIVLIQYNQTDGESVTRVWNAYWWAEHPFFVLPISGHPSWFYVIGPVFFIFKDIYLVPIYIMILMMTVSGIYLFKITYLISDFRRGLLAYCVFTTTPVLIPFNFAPSTYQLLPILYTIMVYYFMLSIQTGRMKYNLISGIFAFLAVSFRPDALAVIIPFCILAYLLKRDGSLGFIILALIFQIIWWLYSIYLYGNPIYATQHAIEYGMINGANLGLRVKGFFLPFFFLLTGITFLLFYIFIIGLFRIYRAYPKYILITLIIPIIMPILVNSIVSLNSTFTHSVWYIISMYFFSPIIIAYALSELLEKFKQNYIKVMVASIIIISSIPLAYVKDILPQNYKTLYPKAIQPLMTTKFPKETRLLFDFVESNKGSHPALIYDYEGSEESNELCVVYRSRFVPLYTSLVTNYNVPTDEPGLVYTLVEFIQKNPIGMIIVKNKKTLLHDIVNKKNGISSLGIDLTRVLYTEHFTAFLYNLRKQ